MIARVLVALLALPGPCPDSLPLTLTGVCQYGKITQCGRRITVDGESFLGAGQIDGDTVRIVWIGRGEHADARAMIGVYRVQGRELIGRYGYADAVEIVGGQLVGESIAERLTIAD